MSIDFYDYQSFTQFLWWPPVQRNYDVIKTGQHFNALSAGSKHFIDQTQNMIMMMLSAFFLPLIDG
jgi:hypothetical protein